MANVKRIIAKIVIDNNIIMTIDNNLLSAEIGALDRGSLTDVVDWGIYANRGSISFIDRDGYFNNININSSQIKNAKVQFYLKKNEEKPLATFDVADLNFDDVTRRVDIELQSHLLTWQNIYTKKSYWYVSKSVRDLALEVFNDLGISLEGTDYNAWHGVILSGVYIPQNTNLWELALKFCQLEMVRIFDNVYGEATVLPNSTTPIVIDVNNAINYKNFDFVSIPNAKIQAVVRNVFKNQVIAETLTQLDILGMLTSATLENSNTYEDENLVVEFSDWKTLSLIEYRTVTITKIFNLSHEVFGVNIGTVANQETTQNGTTTAKHIDAPITDYIITTSSDNKTLTMSFTFTFWTKTKNATTGSVTKETIINKLRFYGYGEYFEDDGSIEENYTTINNISYHSLNSNDLLTTTSSIRNEHRYLYEYILDAVKNKYSNGIECLECECLMNDYADENKEIVLSGNDLDCFKKYDIVIPYTVRQGARQPLRTYADGTPKKFRIIGIQYSYKGFIRQKLQLQEEKYND